MKRLDENTSCCTLEIKNLNLYEPHRNVTAILRLIQQKKTNAAGNRNIEVCVFLFKFKKGKKQNKTKKEACVLTLLQIAI